MLALAQAAVLVPLENVPAAHAEHLFVTASRPCPAPHVTKAAHDSADKKKPALHEAQCLPDERNA